MKQKATAYQQEAHTDRQKNITLRARQALKKHQILFHI